MVGTDRRMTPHMSKVVSDIGFIFKVVDYYFSKKVKFYPFS